MPSVLGTVGDVESVGIRVRLGRGGTPSLLAGSRLYRVPARADGRGPHGRPAAPARSRRAVMSSARSRPAGLSVARARLASETSRPARTNALTSAAAAADTCLLYTSPSPRDGLLSRMPS